MGMRGGLRPFSGASTPDPKSTGRLIDRLPVALTVGGVLTTVVAPEPADAAVSRSFTPRFSVNAAGAIAAVGAPLLTCPGEAAGCAGALAGAESGRNNNEFAVRHIDVDGDSTTFTSASTALSLPADATVAWAVLGRRHQRRQ